MLKAVPKSWFSWDFTVMDESRPVAEIDVSRWREKGLLTVEGATYQVYREGLMSGAFVLESAGSALARAEKPSAFHRSFIIEHAGKRYTLRARSAFGREFLLLDGAKEIGSLSPEGFFTRRARANLPELLPLPVRIFILWLAFILWKRESDSGGAA
jgi:hypothetical protein